MSEKREVHENFGNMIRYLRNKRGFSLKELEEITGVSASYINRLEKGQRKAPSFPIIEILCRALGVPEYEMLQLKNFTRKEKGKEGAKFIGEILLTSDFLLQENIATQEEKKFIVDIIEEIIYCEWNESTKVADILEISKLIDQFKEV